VKDEPTFIDTLDYIFLSPEWAVTAVEELPHRSLVAGPLPNQQEPSDHLLLATTLKLY
jgi:2',5'-phosphodiesterase